MRSNLIAFVKNNYNVTFLCNSRWSSRLSYPQKNNYRILTKHLLSICKLLNIRGYSMKMYLHFTRYILIQNRNGDGNNNRNHCSFILLESKFGSIRVDFAMLWFCNLPNTVAMKMFSKNIDVRIWMLCRVSGALNAKTNLTSKFELSECHE